MFKRIICLLNTILIFHNLLLCILKFFEKVVTKIQVGLKKEKTVVGKKEKKEKKEGKKGKKKIDSVIEDPDPDPDPDPDSDYDFEMEEEQPLSPYKESTDPYSVEEYSERDSQRWKKNFEKGKDEQDRDGEEEEKEEYDIDKVLEKMWKKQFLEEQVSGGVYTRKEVLWILRERKIGKKIRKEREEREEREKNNV